MTLKKFVGRFTLSTISGPVAHQPNNCLNRTGLEPVSALKLCYVNSKHKHTFLLFQTLERDYFLLLPNRKDSEG